MRVSSSFYSNKSCFCQVLVNPTLRFWCWYVYPHTLRENWMILFWLYIFCRRLYFLIRISTKSYNYFQLLPRLTPKELQNLVINFAGENVSNLTFILDFVSHGISFIGSCAAHYSTMPQVNSNSIISCIGQMLNNFLVVLQVCS